MSAARPARRPLRVDHVAFPVFDAAATFRFYTEVMRLPHLTSDKEHYVK